MATLNKFNQFVADLANKVHNFSSDTITIALSNTAPVATNAVLTDISQISYTGLSSRALALTSSTQTSGTYRYIVANAVLTATATVGPFRYAVIYNSTAGSGNLIAFADLGSAITLSSGESLTLAFDATNGVLSLA